MFYDLLAEWYAQPLKLLVPNLIVISPDTFSSDGISQYALNDKTKNVGRRL